MVPWWQCKKLNTVLPNPCNQQQWVMQISWKGKYGEMRELIDELECEIALWVLVAETTTYVCMSAIALLCSPGALLSNENWTTKGNLARGKCRRKIKTRHSNEIFMWRAEREQRSAERRETMIALLSACLVFMFACCCLYSLLLLHKLPYGFEGAVVKKNVWWCFGSFLTILRKYIRI